MKKSVKAKTMPMMPPVGVGASRDQVYKKMRAAGKQLKGSKK